MEIRPIRTEADHAAALREIETLWGAKPGTPEGDKLDVLLTLAEAWEAQHHRVDPPDPIDAIKFRLEQQDLGHDALRAVIGSRSRVYEVLNHRRPLTLGMIRRLAETFGIPPHVLIRESPEVKKRADRKRRA